MISFHKYVVQNLFLLSKVNSVSKPGCKQQIFSYVLGVNTHSEDTDACYEFFVKLSQEK